MSLRGYRSCSGTTGMSNVIQFNPLIPGCGQPTPVTAMSTLAVVEVTDVCPGQVTNCVTPGQGINGVQEYYWYRDFDICSVPNCIYSISWGQCCRNAQITNGPGSLDMYTNSTTLNTGITPCNNSPQFANVPVPYICSGQPYTFNQGATDPDGDDLVYSLGTCFTGPNQPFPYYPGFTPLQPLGTSWTVSIDPNTGDVDFQPTGGGNIVVAVVCVYIEEWRNGNLLNTIVRDMQVNVLPCTNIVPAITGASNASGGIQTGPFTFTVCAGNQLTFDLPVVDPDPGQIHTVNWNQNIPGMTFTSGSQVNTIVGPTPTVNVAWTPTVPGTYSFLVTAKDDACPILGTTQRTIVITVQGGLPGASITANPTGCTNVALAANPGTANSGPYTYQWSGDGNLDLNPNTSNQTLTHTYPGPGTYEVRLLITDNFGCTVELVEQVVIPNGPTSDGGPDVTVCSGNAVNLGNGNLPPGQTYTWSPATGLSSTTSPDPVFNYSLPGTGPQTITYTVTATSGFCTAIDYVTVVVNPAPVAVISGPVSVCNGQNVTLTASGGTGFLWSNGATTPSIVVNPASTTTYTVTAISNGCASPVVQHTVTVETGPTAVITGIDSVCAGASTTLTATGGSSWLWDNNATTQTITVNNINGTQTVSVVASDNGCPGPPAYFTIYNYASPEAEFSHSTVCIGSETSFSDLSTIPTGGAGGIISWSWDFDDPVSGTLNHSNTQNPSHQFSTPGFYNVELTVTGYNGCIDVITHQVLVRALPVVEFEAADVCDGKTMVFTDQSTANSGIQSWLWDFGGGMTSNLQNPTFAFSGPGTYNVLLIVTDANGCQNSRERTVLVHPNPIADFGFRQHCFFSEAQFFSAASLNDPLGTTIDEHSWNFGDPASGANNTSNAQNPTHVWASGPRTYNVTLTVTTSRGCSHSITYPVVVPVIPGLDVTHDSICRGFPAQLEVGIPPAGTILEWFYTPLSTEPFQIGDHVFETPALDVTTHYYVAYRDADGCLSPKTGVVAYVYPEANVTISASANEVEIPNAMVEFNITNVYNGPLSSLTWNFGDGVTSGDMNPVHQYNEAGVYDVSLSMVNAFGCLSEQSWPQYVRVNKLVSLFVPNAFSPNGDGLNDVFTVSTRLIIDFQINIYDRWGKLIYASGNPGFEWNGTDDQGKQVPEGVYTYTINSTDWDGQKIDRAGTITVIR